MPGPMRHLHTSVALVLCLHGCGGAASGERDDGSAPGDAVSTADGTPSPNDAAPARLDATRGPADAATPPGDGMADAASPERDAARRVVDAGRPGAGCAGGYRAPRPSGTLADPAIVEASGVVASRLHPGVLWIHNDSGDGPRLYATRTDGEALGRFDLEDTDAVDFEDLAAAPCPDGGACLWVGDIGDHGGAARVRTVHVVPEPEVDPSSPAADPGAPPTLPIAVPWRVHLDPASTPADFESLFVRTEDDGAFALHLVEKIDGDRARVFRAITRFEDDTPLVPEVIATLAAPGVPVERGRMITGGDLHPSGRRLVLRVYTGTFEYRLDADADLRGLGTLDPIQVALGPITERQGEAVGYDEDGLGIWTVSEDPDRNPGVPLNYYACED